MLLDVVMPERDGDASSSIFATPSPFATFP